MESLLYEILCLQQRNTDQRPSWPVEAMLQHIEAHADRQVSIEELAAVAGLSPAYAARQFKAQMGLPPVRYATEVRMRRAAAWLRDDAQVSIIEIAKRVGYDDPYHFSRCFKRWAGISPRAWREREANVSR